MATTRRRGVVKQLSNLSIDEVSLVDRGANQHALVSIAKRYSPDVEDIFEVEKINIPKIASAIGRVSRKKPPKIAPNAPSDVDALGNDILSRHHDTRMSLAHDVDEGLHRQSERSLSSGAAYRAGQTRIKQADLANGNPGGRIRPAVRKALEASDFFEDVEKKDKVHVSPGTSAALAVVPPGSLPAAFHNRQSRTGWSHGGLKTLGGALGGGVAGAKIGDALGGAKGATLGGVAGQAVGAATTVHVHNHNGESHFHKSLGDEPMDVNDLFDIEKKKGSSFGQGGEQTAIDEFSGNDPAGVTDDENAEDGDVGPGGNVSSGTEKTKGEDMPPKKKSNKGGSKEINPAPLSGLGKSAEFWTSVVSKVLSGESTTEDELDDTIEKHFPGGGGQQPVPGNPQNPMQSPFPGAQGAGQPPMMQTPGVQPMGMGQPTPPPGQPTGGMPQQLPPDVIAYIQQLEQALDQATGGQQDGQESGDESGSSDPNQSGSTNNDDKKNNPFGKSGDFDMSDDLFLQELAKSLDDEDQREAVGKALEAVSKAEQRAIQAETIAKQERDLRLEKEFISKAAEFNVPVRAEELGPVLKRMAESVTREDFQVIVKCLNAVSATDDIFGEVGKRGGGANGSILDEVNARALALTTGGEVGKALSPEAAVAEVFEMDPRAYDAYLSDHPSRRISH